MGEITWKRSVLTDLEGVYCLELFNMKEGLKIFAASESHGGHCKMIDFVTRTEEIIWYGPGGCMNIGQLNEQGTVIGVVNFYKGYQSKEAQLIRADKYSDGWKTEVLKVIPYLHRSGIVHTEADGDWVIASQLCTERADTTDWSHPGRILAARLPDLGEEISFQVLQENITKNHGFWQGLLDNEQVTLVGGEEGLFRVRPPKNESGWQVDCLMNREVSDMAVADLDGDGEDELVVFDGFHGDLCTVNKRIDGEWKVVYSLPMHFSHAIWAGKLLNRNVFVVGYRKKDGLLYLGEHTKNGYKATLLEAGIAPSNVRGFMYEGRSFIAVAARDMGQVILFELTEE